MKLIIVVLASDNALYNAFKKLWINHLKLLSPHLRKQLELYFLYSSDHSNQQIIHNHIDNYVDFYEPTIKGDVSKNMFVRTISLFKYIRQKYTLDDDNNYNTHINNKTFILRTNLTTLFDFEKLIDWFQNKPQKALLAGSFIGLYNLTNTTISGTNLIITIDLMMILTDLDINIMNYELLAEDELLSSYIIQNYNVHIINLKRLDLIEMNEQIYNYVYPKSVIYHKCHPGDDSIFSFRFKTFDRNSDLNNMQFFSNNIYTKYTLTNIVNLFLENNKNWIVTTENPEYASNYSEQTFKILNLSLSRSLHL